MKEIVSCPVCEEKKIYSISHQKMITYVSNFEYEVYKDYLIDSSFSGQDIDVYCNGCKTTWETAQNFCVDWNNKYRFDEANDDGGWGSHAAWAIGESNNIKHFISVLKFGVGIELTPGQEKAIWDKLQQYHDEKNKSEILDENKIIFSGRNR